MSPTLGDRDCPAGTADGQRRCSRASVRVAERLGMHLVGEVVVPANERWGPVTACHFTIAAAEWRHRRPVPGP